MHIHLHVLMHFIRLLGMGNVRFFGAMLITLLFSLIQLDDTKTSHALGTVEASHHVITATINGDSSIPCAWRR